MSHAYIFSETKTKTNMKAKDLTLEERKVIEKMLKLGHSCSAISKMLGRGKNTVVAEVRRNGGPDVYTAAKGEKYNANSKIRRKEKLIKAMKDNPNITSGLWHKKLASEIGLMKVQIDILQETLTKLMEKQYD